jgi:pilus assembly protein Flp/PilA
MRSSTRERLKRFLSDESGPTAVEYAVMLAMIIAVCLASIGAVGQQSLQLWNSNQTGLSSAFGN